MSGTVASPTTGRSATERGRRLRLAVEYLVLFYGAVAAFAWWDVPGGPVPELVLLGALAWWWLRRQPTFDRADLGRPAALRPALPAVLRLWTVAFVLAVVVVAVLTPERLFDLPRQQPVIWVAVVVLYPVLSVYPQELIFRAFLCHRYAPVFGRGGGLVAASAAAFGFAHIIFGSWLSVLLTLVGGVLFARRYLRTRSLLVVWVEHAAYGVLAFTVGLGAYFYHAAQ